MKTFIQTLFFFLLVMPICFAQWVQIGLDGKSIDEIAVKDQTIFATTDEYGEYLMDNFVGKLYRSLDNGFNWTMIVDTCLDVAISGTGKIFMIKLNNLLQEISFYSSTDNGDSWMLSDAVVQLADSFGYVYPNNIKVTPEGNVILSIIYPGNMGLITGFGISNDDGLSWSTPGPTVRGGSIFDFRDNFLITSGFLAGAGAYHGYIYLSSDYGITWNHLGDPPSHPYAIGFFENGNIILVGGANSEIPPGVYISEDMCNTWVQIATLNFGTSPIRRVGLHWSSSSSEGMLIGIEDLGVLLFSDEGDSLGSWNEGLTNINVQALTLDNNGYVYAGTSNGVWRRPLSEIVTSVEENQIEIPSSFNLSQNFPNPFNPSTKIKYSVPQTSQVQIKVYDVLGNEIETLVNEEKSIGIYELNLEADNLPSGVYFYQLKAGEFTRTKKMLLLK